MKTKYTYPHLVTRRVRTTEVYMAQFRDGSVGHDFYLEPEEVRRAYKYSEKPFDVVRFVLDTNTQGADKTNDNTK